MGVPAGRELARSAVGVGLGEDIAHVVRGSNVMDEDGLPPWKQGSQPATILPPPKTTSHHMAEFVPPPAGGGKRHKGDAGESMDTTMLRITGPTSSGGKRPSAWNIFIKQHYNDASIQQLDRKERLAALAVMARQAGVLKGEPGKKRAQKKPEDKQACKLLKNIKRELMLRMNQDLAAFKNKRPEEYAVGKKGSFQQKFSCAKEDKGDKSSKRLPKGFKKAFKNNNLSSTGKKAKKEEDAYLRGAARTLRMGEAYSTGRLNKEKREAIKAAIARRGL